MLFNKFGWEFPIVPSNWVGPIIVLFMVLTSGIVFYALTLWKPKPAPLVEKNPQTKDEQIAKTILVAQKIKECDKSFNRMLAEFAKQSRMELFESSAFQDSDFQEKLKPSYYESVSDFGAKVSELKTTIESCSFLLDSNISYKAKELSEAYNTIAYGILNNDKDGKASGIVAKLNNMILDFEADVRKYLG